MTYGSIPDEELKKRFTYHPPMEETRNGSQILRYQQIRETGHDVARIFNAHCPPGRELSLAMTNLEQAVMWANAAIARNE